jgi:co-chaperonin GroES (HSP10)
MKRNRSLTSLIEDHEEAEAKDLIASHLGFTPGEPFSRKIAVKIYVRPDELSTVVTDEGKEIKLYLPLTISANDKYRNCTGLVISVAKDCYLAEQYQESGPYCKVGDWVMIPRNVGTQVNYRGAPVQVIPEDAIYCVIEDPEHIERYFK